MERKKRTRKQGKYSQGENGISENEEVLTSDSKDIVLRLRIQNHITSSYYTLSIMLCTIHVKR